MLRLGLIRFTCGIALALSASVASAAFLDFIENPDEISAVTVTTNLVSATGGLPSIVSTAETASIDGFHTPGISPSPVLPLGLHYAGLYEPGTTVLSDLVILEAFGFDTSIDPCPIPGIVQCQRLIVRFFSDVDGGPPLEDLVPQGVFVPAIEEDGTLQDISALLGTLPEGLIVRVQSDAHDQVPEPGSLALLGLGLAALGFSRRRKA